MPSLIISSEDQFQRELTNARRSADYDWFSNSTFRNFRMVDERFEGYDLNNCRFIQMEMLNVAFVNCNLNRVCFNTGTWLYQPIFQGNQHIHTIEFYESTMSGQLGDCRLFNFTSQGSHRAPLTVVMTRPKKLTRTTYDMTIRRGCFTGTLAEFKDAVEHDYYGMDGEPNNINGEEYAYLIQYLTRLSKFPRKVLTPARDRIQ